MRGSCQARQPILHLGGAPGTSPASAQAGRADGAPRTAGFFWFHGLETASLGSPAGLRVDLGLSACLRGSACLEGGRRRRRGLPEGSDIADVGPDLDSYIPVIAGTSIRLCSEDTGRIWHQQADKQGVRGEFGPWEPVLSSFPGVSGNPHMHVVLRPPAEHPVDGDQCT